MGGQLSLAVDMLKTCGGVFARGCTREFITRKSPKLFLFHLGNQNRAKAISLNSLSHPCHQNLL